MLDALLVRGPRGRLMVLALGLAVSGVVVAQTAAPVAAPAKAAQPAKPAAKTAKKPAAPAFKMVLEPRAMDLLKATSARLAAAKGMSFTAVVGYEYPSKLGPPIVYTTRYDVTMRRPDKLRIIIPGDGPASEFYYDGKTVMAYAPAENLVAVADAPPTIDGARLDDCVDYFTYVVVPVFFFVQGHIKLTEEFDGACGGKGAQRWARGEFASLT
jgi:hypothetical protein